MTGKITITYKTSDKDVMKTGWSVVEKMENNPDFSNPPEALAKLKAALPEFQTTISNATNRDKRMVAIKNNKKVIVLALLQELADFVTVTSKGDLAIALGSGFEIPADNVNGKQPPAIAKLEVALHQPGEATTLAREVTSIKAYTHQYTTDPPTAQTAWIGEGSSLASHTFQGLTSDKRYWFRVVAVGTNGQRGYSPIVTRVIQ